MPFGRDAGRRHAAVDRLAEIGQGVRILQTPQYATDDDAILIVQVVQKGLAAVPLEHLAQRRHQLGPAVLLGLRENFLQVRHHVAVTAGDHDAVNQAGVRVNNLLVLFRQCGHRCALPQLRSG